MTVVADSSPLIILAKLGCFDFLNKLYPRLYISNEVYSEVVTAGTGQPGASQVAEAAWIEVRHVLDRAALVAAYAKSNLGLGELSTILLGKEVRANALLLDDSKARLLAREEGLLVRGSVGLLETFFQRGYLTDLRSTFQQLTMHNVYVDQRLLNRRLRFLGLPPL